MARSAPVQVPGAEGAASAQSTNTGDGAAVDPRDAEIARLRAELAAKGAGDKLPQVVYEPDTPKGKLAKEASAFSHLTVEALMAEIDAGNVKEPITSVLCANGWYAARPKSAKD